MCQCNCGVKWVYHVDPVFTTLGSKIPHLWQVHKQDLKDTKWTFVAVLLIVGPKSCPIHVLTGSLTPEELTIVEDRLT